MICTQAWHVTASCNRKWKHSPVQRFALPPSTNAAHVDDITIHWTKHYRGQDRQRHLCNVTGWSPPSLAPSVLLTYWLGWLEKVPSSAASSNPEHVQNMGHTCSMHNVRPFHQCHSIVTRPCDRTVDTLCVCFSPSPILRVHGNNGYPILNGCLCKYG